MGFPMGMMDGCQTNLESPGSQHGEVEVSK